MTIVLSDEQFRLRYRFSRNGFQFILNQIKSNLRPTRFLNRPISIEDQLLTTLKFYATGLFQLPDNDIFGEFESICIRIVCKVSRLISTLAPKYITFPSESEQDQLRNRFFNVSGFPGVVGSIDCVHIPVKNPSFCNNSIKAKNRSIRSLDAQILMDHECRIIHIITHLCEKVSKRPAFIDFDNYLKLEDLTRGFWLLGDVRYPCLPYLMTPFAQLRSTPQKKFNAAHKSTRNLTEKGIIRWKSRFPVLDSGLNIKPKYCPQIVVACAVLHNIAILLREEAFTPLNETNSEPPEINAQLIDPIGDLVRNTIVGRYFT